ncbi:MAG: hypothetical protein A2Y17_00170 [Clostridiales bacterium GWF2_38_85]|nr:MAG: hypothetical protein A2Y17_00170 [Clostridiales bacterium GWF2_38_85]HBL83875.1 RNHCP domain-containing protein [Clostridiales bacterium]
MKIKRFVKNDDTFICKNCGATVPQLGYTSRNHCPKCLYSLHVDVNPGDRANNCGGLMRPVAVIPHPKKGYIITHKCIVCGFIGKNKAADDDNTDLLIKYTNPDNL